MLPSGVSFITELCHEHVRIMTEFVPITAICTLPKDHEGKHYDSIFHLEWRQALYWHCGMEKLGISRGS